MPTGYTVDDDKKQRIVEAHTKHKVPVSELAKGYGVNRKTIYKWLAEAKEKETQVSTDKANNDTPSTEAPEAPAPEAPEKAPEQPETPEPAQEGTEQADGPEKAVNKAQEEAEKILADARAEAERIKAEAAADANETRAKAQEDADAIRQEVKDAADKVASSEPADVPQEEVDCPNPSCDAKFSGNECPNCGFKHDATVDPFKAKAK